MSFACTVLIATRPPSAQDAQVLNSMTLILDLVRQKISEILDIYPVSDVEDTVFKQRIFKIFKEGS